jgi:arabinofuranosyltransferase
MAFKKLVLPLFLLVFLFLFTLIYWWGYGKPLIGIDDANIYFVYMKNFADGHGFVWNVGGEKVEGFTSLLWTLIGALFYKISSLNFPILLLILGFTLSYFIIYKILRFIRKLNNTEERAITSSDVIVLFLLIAPRGFIEWNILCLMETPLWSFLLVSTTLLLCNYYFNGQKINMVSLSVLLVLINLTRPESIAFNFIFIVILFVMLSADRGWKYSFHKILIPVISLVVSLGALLLWRIRYFGYPLPNTYYAKVSGSEKSNLTGGLGYLFHFFNNYVYSAFILSLLFFFGLVMLYKWRKGQQSEVFSSKEKAQAVLISVIFSGLAFPVLTGGDNFHFSRFYQPIIPLIYLAIANYYLWFNYLGISIQNKRLNSFVITVSVLLAIFFSSKSNFTDFFKKDPLNFPEFVIAANGRKAAVELNESFAACKVYPAIGSFATGAVGYSYNGKTIDLLGLNSTLMAHANNIKTGTRNHASFDKKAFWLLKPDIIGTAFGGEIIYDTSAFVLYENLPGYRDNNFIYVAYKKIFDDYDFRQAYVPALVQYRNKKFFVFGYWAKSFLESLNKSVYSIKILQRNFNLHIAYSGN